MVMTHCNEVIAHLPPLPESAETVVCTLLGQKPMTGKQLREATGLPRRTLYTALQRLKEAGAINEQVSLKDSRQTYFWLKPSLTHVQADEAYAAA